MRWEDERYVRLYTRDTADWLMWPWQARALFPLLLRKVDRAGTLQLGKHGSRGLAIVLSMPPEVVEEGLRGLLEDGCLVQNGDVLVIRNYLEAQEAAASDRQRARECRERAKTRALGESSRNVTPPSRNVTKPSRPVTTSHEPSQSVTPSRAVPCRTDPRKEEAVSADADLPAHSAPASRPTELPAPPSSAKERISAQADQVFQHWCRVMNRNGNTVFAGKRRRVVEARLREGYAAEQLCLAVDGCALTPHNMGQNDRGQRYDDLELICRDPSNVDRFIANATSPPKPPVARPAADANRGIMVAQACATSRSLAAQLDPATADGRALLEALAAGGDAEAKALAQRADEALNGDQVWMLFDPRRAVDREVLDQAAARGCRAAAQRIGVDS